MEERQAGQPGKYSQILDIVPRAEENGHTLVDFLWLNVEHTLLAGRCDTSGLLDKEGHRETFVQETQLTILRLLVIRIRKNATVEQRAVNVSNHGTNVTGRVWLLRWLRELDRFQVLEHWFVVVRAVALVDRVNLAARGDLNVRVGENEFTDRVIKSEAINTVAGREHNIRR